MNDNQCCYVCKFPLEEKPSSLDTGEEEIKCIKCGRYSIQMEVLMEQKDLTNLSPVQRLNISGWLFDNPRTKITLENAERLLNLPTPTVAEKAETVLKYLCDKYPMAGDQIAVDFGKNYHIAQEVMNGKKNVDSLNKEQKEFLTLMTISRSLTGSEFKYIIHDFLFITQNYISLSGNTLKITPVGWAYFHSLQNKNINSKLVFIAMSFRDELMKFSERYVEPAIRNAGYTSKRVDKHNHNNLIDDEMIALIRQSRFIIADYTNNSHGVYYEAGFAHGLGIEVIRLCEEKFFDQGKGIHFDQNHYPILLWDYDKGDELRKNLTARIRALGY